MKLEKFCFCSKMLKIELKFIKYVLDTFDSASDNNIIYYDYKSLTKELKLSDEKFQKVIDALLSKRYYYKISMKDKDIEGKFTFLSSFTRDGGTVMLIPSKEVIENYLPNTIFYETDMDSFFCLKNNKSINLLLEIKEKKREGEGFEISLEDFKELLGIEDGYTRFYDFERFVLQDIVSDINKNSYVKISYTKVKKGKSLNSKVEGLIFYMLDKKQKLIIEETNELLELVKYRIKDISTIYHLIRSTLKRYGKQYVKANLEVALDKKGRELDIIVIRALKENWAKFEQEVVSHRGFKLLYSDSSFFTHHDLLLYDFYNQLKALGINVDFNKEIRHQMGTFAQTHTINYEDNKYRINVRYHKEGRSNIRVYGVQ